MGSHPLAEEKPVALPVAEQKPAILPVAKEEPAPAPPVAEEFPVKQAEGKSRDPFQSRKKLESTVP